MLWTVIKSCTLFFGLAVWAAFRGNPGAPPTGGQSYVDANTTIAKDTPAETCSICLEEFVAGDAVRETRCHHFFHTKCVDGWLYRKRTCPVCKQSVEGAVIQRRSGMGSVVIQML